MEVLIPTSHSSKIMLFKCSLPFFFFLIIIILVIYVLAFELSLYHYIRKKKLNYRKKNSLSVDLLL